MLARRLLSRISGRGRRYTRDLGAINELRNPEQALSSVPAGYYRLKKRIRLFRRRSSIKALVPSPPESLIASAGELVYLGAIFAEAGYHTEASRHLEMALRRASDVYEGVRFMGLTRSAGYFSDALAKKYATDLDAYAFLEHHEGAFAELVKKHRNSICVVGNSPCEIGKGHGKKIDDHALVIRFNDFSDTLEFSHDYGRKCDVWCRTPHFFGISRRQGFNPPLTIIPTSLMWRQVNGQDMVLDFMRLARPMCSAPIATISQLVADCGSQPSSGLIVLRWIMSVLGNLEGVSVYGFSLSDQVDGAKHYFRPLAASSGPPHDWLTERKILDEMLSCNKLHSPQ